MFCAAVSNFLFGSVLIAKRANEVIFFEEMDQIKLSLLALLGFFATIESTFYNLSCVVGLCERFNIRNIDLVDFSYGINSGPQSLPGKMRNDFS